MQHQRPANTCVSNTHDTLNQTPLTLSKFSDLTNNFQTLILANHKAHEAALRTTVRSKVIL